MAKKAIQAIAIIVGKGPLYLATKAAVISLGNIGAKAL
jgi:hypothetical protein